MPPDQVEFLQRASIEGELCTVRRRIPEGVIPNTKGVWLGVEWDDQNRGKHDGTYNGQKYFSCRSQRPNVASFIKASRKFDEERTVTEAIRYKYGGADDGGARAKDVVVISGKIAEEVGFDKIAREQAVLENLKIVVLEKLIVCGVAPRGASRETVRLAQQELASICPNIIELDLSYNTIERWSDIYDICVALPKLRTLRLNGLRFYFTLDKLNCAVETSFSNVHELHLNECLLEPSDLFQILGSSSNIQLPNLAKLWLSQNDLHFFALPEDTASFRYQSVVELILEYNSFKSLDSLDNIMTTFPNLKTLSFQHNQIEAISERSSLDDRSAINPQPGLESLSVSQNRITSFDFIDALSTVLPNLTSLRTSQNPLYQIAQSVLSTTNPSETTYYLTLARMPKLKTLNYTHITTREREEGEIYYLSVAERDIRASLAAAEPNSLEARTSVADFIRQKYSRYQVLCEKYDRESLMTQLLSPGSEPRDRILAKESKLKNPPGSIAANLVETKFYIRSSSVRDRHHKPTDVDKRFTHLVPHSTPTSQVFALVARSFNLAPLQFKMIYESAEFDPVGDDTTTRSQMYASDGTKSSSKDRWRSWGDWDADAMVESSLLSTSGGVDDNGDKNSSTQNPSHEDGKADQDEKWTEDGHLLKQGKKWKRREVDILMGLRNWIDWLDGDADSVSVRVEPY